MATVKSALRLYSLNNRPVSVQPMFVLTAGAIAGIVAAVPGNAATRHSGTGLNFDFFNGEIDIGGHIEVEHRILKDSNGNSEGNSKSEDSGGDSDDKSGADSNAPTPPSGGSNHRTIDKIKGQIKRFWDEFAGNYAGKSIPGKIWQGASDATLFAALLVFFSRDKQSPDSLAKSIEEYQAIEGNPLIDPERFEQRMTDFFNMLSEATNAWLETRNETKQIQDRRKAMKESLTKLQKLIAMKKNVSEAVEGMKERHGARLEERQQNQQRVQQREAIKASLINTTKAVAKQFLKLGMFIASMVVFLHSLFNVFAIYLSHVFVAPIASIEQQFIELGNTVIGVMHLIAASIDALFGSDLSSQIVTIRSNLSGMTNSVTKDYVEMHKQGLSVNSEAVKGYNSNSRSVQMSPISQNVPKGTSSLYSISSLGISPKTASYNAYWDQRIMKSKLSTHYSKFMSRLESQIAKLISKTKGMSPWLGTMLASQIASPTPRIREESSEAGTRLEPRITDSISKIMEISLGLLTRLVSQITSIKEAIYNIINRSSIGYVEMKQNEERANLHLGATTRPALVPMMGMTPMATAQSTTTASTGMGASLAQMIATNTQRMADAMELSNESMSFLREQIGIAIVTEASKPNVIVHMTNNIYEVSDIDSVLSKLSAGVSAEMDSTGEGMYL